MHVPSLVHTRVYLCEDTHTSYMAAGGEDQGWRHPDSFIEYCKGLIDEMHAWWEGDQLTPTQFTRTCVSMHFYDSVVVFEKGLRDRPFDAVTEGGKELRHVFVPKPLPEQMLDPAVMQPSGSSIPTGNRLAHALLTRHLVGAAAQRELEIPGAARSSRRCRRRRRGSCLVVVQRRQTPTTCKRSSRRSSDLLPADRASDRGPLPRHPGRSCRAGGLA
jgi:hypothetical protein